ncbi:MAG: hypothetical protein IKN72_08005 [Clostridia bacterium]|nr:hypothetical protein [Clostridia bacterium]
MKSYTEIADAVFEKGNAQLQQVKRRRKSIRRGVAVGALALIAVGAVTASRLWLPQQKDEPALTADAAANEPQQSEGITQSSAAESTDAVNGVMQPFGEPVTFDAPLPLIRDFSDSTDGKYPCPRPGQHIVTIPLQDAVRVHAGEDVVYYIQFQVMNDALGSMTTEQQQAFYLSEIDRIHAAGGEGADLGVTTETDADETQRVVLFALMHDPSFLDRFPDSEEYGYFIALYDEQSCVK